MDKSTVLVDDEIRQLSASYYGSFAEWVLAPAVIVTLLAVIIRLEATGQAARSPWSIPLASFCVGLLAVTYVNCTRQCRCLATLARSKSLQSQRGQCRLEAIIRASTEAVVTVDAARRIVLFSPMAQVLFGYVADDLAGQPTDRLIPLRLRAAHRVWVEQFGRARSNERRMGSQRQVFALHIDGHEFPIEASILHSGGVGTKWYTIMLRDVSECVKANEAQIYLQEELHDPADSALSAREEDQRAIAGELQQGFGPHLRVLYETAVGIAEQMQPAVLTGCWRRLDAIRVSLEATDRSIRCTCSDLRPQLFDDPSLVLAIRWIATDFEQRYHTAVMVNVDIYELGGYSSIGVFRVVQEVLINVACHAQAPQVYMMSTRWAATVRYPQRTTEQATRRSGTRLSSKVSG